MADKTITALTGASTPLAGTEVLPIVQSGATVKVATNDLTVRNVRANATTGILQVVGPTTGTTRVMTTPDANFTAARIDAAQSFTGDQTLATGNLIPGTAAKGINFTANTAAAGMTSQLLNWYEEGTWTPEFSSSGATFAYAEQYGSYVRVGKLVTLQMRLRTSSVTGTTTNGTNVIGIPFASANLNANNASAGSIGLCDVTGGLAMSIGNNETTLINLWNVGIVASPTAASISGKYFIATITYRVA